MFCFYLLLELISVHDVCLSAPEGEIVSEYFAVYGLFFFLRIDWVWTVDCDGKLKKKKKHMEGELEGFCFSRTAVDFNFDWEWSNGILKKKKKRRRHRPTSELTERSRAQPLLQWVVHILPSFRFLCPPNESSFEPRNWIPALVGIYSSDF